MPFQIAQTSFKVKPPAVILISAGDDQQVSCSSTIVLSAIVDDELLLPGHPLEWEQLIGNPVILSCPTCLTATYPLTDLTDKTFRFWIDRGTIDEQYDDISVFHTPTSRLPVSSYYAKPNVEYGVASDSPACSSIVLAPGPAELQSAPSTTGLGLKWNVPPDVLLQPFITQYTVYENGTPVQTTLVDEPRFYPGAIQASYIIFTEFVVNGQYSSEFSCERDFINDLPYPLTIVIDEFLPTSSQISKPNVNLVKYGNIINNEGMSELPTGSQISKPNVNLVNYSNIVISDSLSILPTSSQLPIAVIDITRFDSGGIGG